MRCLKRFTSPDFVGGGKAAVFGLTCLLALLTPISSFADDAEEELSAYEEMLAEAAQEAQPTRQLELNHEPTIKVTEHKEVRVEGFQGRLRDEAVEVEVAVRAPKANEPPLEFMKPLYNTEISFVKRVCNPSDQQMKDIIAAVKTAYQATGDMDDDPNNINFQAGQVRIMGPGNEQLNENPYRRVRRDAKNHLKEPLSDEQYAKYLLEVKQRDDFERGAAIEIVVGLIDDKLPLTGPQRNELVQGLLDKWNDVDLQSVQNYVYNPEYVPQLPPGVIDKVLTKKQMSTWRTLNVMNISFHVGFNNGQNMTLDEEWIK
jgi:hypothetical protein